MAWTQEKAVDEFTADLLAEFSAASAGARGRAVLVVGHMPQLGWIAARLLANRPLWMRAARRLRSDSAAHELRGGGDQAHG